MDAEEIDIVDLDDGVNVQGEEAQNLQLLAVGAPPNQQELQVARNTRRTSGVNTRSRMNQSASFLAPSTSRAAEMAGQGGGGQQRMTRQQTHPPATSSAAAPAATTAAASGSHKRELDEKDLSAQLSPRRPLLPVVTSSEVQTNDSAGKIFFFLFFFYFFKKLILLLFLPFDFIFY